MDVFAVLVGCASDVAKPAYQHCPSGVGGMALLALLCLGLGMWRWPSLRDKGWAVIGFCGVTVLDSGVVILAEQHFGGEHGSVTERVAVSRELQRWLGVRRSAPPSERRVLAPSNAKSNLSAW